MSLLKTFSIILFGFHHWYMQYCRWPAYNLNWRGGVGHPGSVIEDIIIIDITYMENNFCYLTSGLRKFSPEWRVSEHKDFKGRFMCDS